MEELHEDHHPVLVVEGYDGADQPIERAAIHPDVLAEPVGHFWAHNSTIDFSRTQRCHEAVRKPADVVTVTDECPDAEGRPDWSPPLLSSCLYKNVSGKQWTQEVRNPASMFDAPAHHGAVRRELLASKVL